MDGQRGNFYLYHSMDHHWQSFHRDLPNNQPLFYTGDMVYCNTNGFLPAGFSAPKIKAEPPTAMFDAPVVFNCKADLPIAVL